jgi:hypothetical protein
MQHAFGTALRKRPKKRGLPHTGFATDEDKTATLGALQLELRKQVGAFEKLRHPMILFQ